MKSTLEWLECSRCKAAFDVDRLQTVCTHCRSVLLARYRLDEAARTLDRGSLTGRANNLWRYREVLPGGSDVLTLGEGLTPLRRASFIGTANGMNQLWIKDESVNPTGSFKARGMATAVTMARELGARHLALPSAGNAGGAAAAYGALAGLAVDLYLPVWTPEPFRLEAAAHGATIHLVDGDIADCGVHVREGKARHGWFDLSTLWEPYRLEGKKTMGYELAEQLDWKLPDVIVYPTGGGTGLIGMWKAFEEMEQLGLIEVGQRPRMVVVQAEGCAPMVRAFEEGVERATRWENPRTYASGLRVPAAIGDHLILRAVRDSRGTALAVTEREMAKAQLAICRGEGIFAAPEGGATLAAAQKLVDIGWIDSHETVVLFNTGSGLKYPEIPGLRVP
ncbi:MAG: threonine synthase [Acidobacteriota bacterium]|nr:threonine synthase [Acidobacteriota bacterium]MDH3783958.1 threonine synthase [Acidobacteriota bacterium]